MTKYRTRAAALLAAGALAGGVSAATLSAHADDTGSADGSSQTTSDGRGPGGPGGPGGHGPGFGADPTELATALGVSEDKLTTALDAVRDDLRPSDGTKPADGEKPTPPTDAERAQHEAAFAKALAKELGIDEAKVTAALDKARATEKAEHRTDLSTRLDTAVKDGDLTAADKASVLKAFDAGVLGGR